MSGIFARWHLLDCLAQHSLDSGAHAAHGALLERAELAHVRRSICILRMTCHVSARPGRPPSAHRPALLLQRCGVHETSAALKDSR